MAYLNFDIQSRICRFLPVDLAVRCTQVSNELRNLIKSPQFIADHTSMRHTRQHHLLITDKDGCFGFLDNSIVEERYQPNIPASILPVNNESVVGSSHGLVGVLGKDGSSIVLWNPSIRKTLHIHVNCGEPIAITFGVCPTTLDPKILQFTYRGAEIQASLYTLSSRQWRDVEINLPPEINIAWNRNVVTDSSIYWLGYVREQEVERPVTVGFNLTTETFEWTHVPSDVRDPNTHTYIGIFNHKGGLVVVTKPWERATIWVKEENLFNSLFVVNRTPPIKGFTRNGAPVVMTMLLEENYVIVFEPTLDGRNLIGSYLKDHWSVGVTSYMETLLLLDIDDAIGY